jgi:hypothetical protein
VLLAAPQGVPILIGQLLVILNLVAVLALQTTVPTSVWVIMLEHLIIMVWVFVDAGVRPLHPQEHRLLVEKLLLN